MSDRQPSIATHQARPIGMRRTFRIRGLMLVIAGVGLWLAVLRQSPALAGLLVIVLGPAWTFYRVLVGRKRREKGEHFGVVDRLYLIVAAATFSAGVLLLILSPSCSSACASP